MWTWSGGRYRRDGRWGMGVENGLAKREAVFITFPAPSLIPHLPLPMDQAAIDVILAKLAKDVEASIHAFYRGDVRQNTQRIKTDTFVREARAALAGLAAGGEAAPSAGASAGAPMLRDDELTAV